MELQTEHHMSEQALSPFFWLHIKKSGGITTRKLLQPHYVEVDRVNKPMTFIQAKPAQYNDVLNNYRVVLGDLQFKRALFAKTYLYKEQWDQMYSFAFSREPVDRCISMFFYLFFKNKGSFLKQLELSLQIRKDHKRLGISRSFAFDVFLDLIEESQSSESIYRPVDLHFSTHTARMYPDVTDEEGKVLLTEIFRLEDLSKGINKVYTQVGIADRVEQGELRINKGMNRKDYQPSTTQLKKIQRLYKRDFDLYESAEFKI